MITDTEKLLTCLEDSSIHFIECEGIWRDAYGYEKSQMKEDVINRLRELDNWRQRTIELVKDIKEYIEDNRDYQEVHREIRPGNYEDTTEDILFEKHIEEIEDMLDNIIR